jgi:predicted GTPase
VALLSLDTGGLTNQDNIIDNGIQLQVLNALEESDVIYFIVSSRDGVIVLCKINITFDVVIQSTKCFVGVIT